MFSAEYMERSYQPIKFVQDDVDTSINHYTVNKQTLKKSVFHHIDNAIMNTLDSTIPRDDFKSIEECKSPRTKMTAKLYPLVDQVDSLEYNAFLTDK